MDQICPYLFSVTLSPGRFPEPGRGTKRFPVHLGTWAGGEQEEQEMLLSWVPLAAQPSRAELSTAEPSSAREAP